MVVGKNASNLKIWENSYQAVNFWMIHLGEKDLQNKENYGENWIQRIEGRGQLVVGGWKLEETEKIWTSLDDDG